MSKMFSNYVGKANQLFIMSEFLMLGYNVAVPEVDRGDDIFVVRDDDGNLSRIQVKTAQAQENKSGFSAQFNLTRGQINSSPIPEITYVFLIRHQNKWKHQFAIQRRELADILASRLDRSGVNEKITLTLILKNEKATYGNMDFTEYQQLSNLFPMIPH